MKRLAAKSRLTDLVLYIGIAISVLALAVIYALHAVRAGERGELPLKWIGLAGETAVLFGYLARAMRRYWRTGRFWVGFLGFFIAHSLAYTIALLRVQQFPLLRFVYIGIAEWVVMAYLMDILLREQIRPGSSSSHKAP